MNGTVTRGQPFSDNANELKRRRAETALINLALEVLHRAAARPTVGAVGTVEVRLALRVLHPFLRDVSLLQEYWRNATEEPRKAWSSCQLPYRWIAAKLVERGYAVNAELR